MVKDGVVYGFDDGRHGTRMHTGNVTRKLFVKCVVPTTCTCWVTIILELQ
jgi:hypothetical protein